MSDPATVANRRPWSPWLVVWLLQLAPLVFVLLELPLRLFHGARVEWTTLLAELPVLGYAVLVASLGGTRRGRRWLSGHSKQLALAAAATLVTYLCCELAASLLALHGGLGQRRKSFIVYENAGQTLHFDPIRGYRLTQTPSRYARITDGTLEYVGHARGNNQGFPDRDDIQPERSDLRKRRLAVFGDSFTAAQFLKTDWPDLVEDLTRQDAAPLELLNFSIDGGGLANWWSVLTRFVQPEHYQLDGVVFAVYSGDLRRGFSITEYRGYPKPMFARVPSWKPEDFPTTPEAAESFYEPWDASIVGEKEFEGFLAGRWRPRPPIPFLASLLYSKVVRPAFRGTRMAARGMVDVESDRRARIEDLRRLLHAMNVPALVVSIPSREDLIRQGAPGELDQDARDFAQWIGAESVNGGAAFAGMTAAQIRADWLPYDGHWAQAGSDRFAQFMLGVLNRWPRDAKTAVGADGSYRQRVTP